MSTVVSSTVTATAPDSTVAGEVTAGGEVLAASVTVALVRVSCCSFQGSAPGASNGVSEPGHGRVATPATACAMLAACASDTDIIDVVAPPEGVVSGAAGSGTAVAVPDAALPGSGVVLSPLSLLLLGLLRTEWLLTDDSDCSEPLVLKLGCNGSIAQANVECVGDANDRR